MFIIGEKPNYTATFDTQNLFSFDRENDIWDDKFLIQQINKLDITVLEKIKLCLEKDFCSLRFWSSDL